MRVYVRFCCCNFAVTQTDLIECNLNEEAVMRPDLCLYLKEYSFNSPCVAALLGLKEYEAEFAVKKCENC